LLLSVAQLPGAPIIFTFTGSGAGSLDGTPFSLSDFTITGVGDTGSRTAFPGGYAIGHTSASINIGGLGTLSFITATETFVNNTNKRAGFTNTTDGSDLFYGPSNAALGTWDMLTSFGPVAGSGAILQWMGPPFDPTVTTDQGVLRFNDASGFNATFQAVVRPSEVPEPGSLALAAFGLMALVALRRRVRQAHS